ncbi:hypothetical protein JJ685_23435 [Ramlibacter monticola]|uniref:Uncharacterized protein n=1 Tax=Ramlibacter monticola TaxID=1926872 RepID=A0A937CWW7_9BURK|nr:hypothetical protein [Ramlibacter monticola]MBL0394112.1 hypothetical protein [Ramlibacter monticola]
MAPPPVVQELQNARYQVSFVDAVTGAAIADPLKVSFAGEAQLKAADGTSLNGKSLTTSAGTVFVSADFTSTANEFTVQVADAGTKGWVPSGTRVIGTANLKGDQAIEVRMVNTTKAAAVNASPEPIAMAVVTGSVTASGATAAAITSTTTPKTVTTEEGVSEVIGTASVAISAGTVGKTASGAAAAPGPLTVSNTYFSNATLDALEAFPGGFAATVVVPAANAAVLNGVAPDAGTFVTAGFAQFNVTDSAGNAIKTFDKPLTLGIDMPKGTAGANGAALVAGDQYPVWSYDDNAGTWKFETLGTVAEKTPVDSKNFTVQFQTTHLSTWSLSQYLASCTASVNLTGRPASDVRLLDVEVVGTTGQRYGTSLPVTDSNLTLLRAPQINATITVRDRGTVVGQVTNQALCGGAISVPVTLPVLQLGNVRIETLESCTDGSSERAIAAAASVRYTSGEDYSRSAYTTHLATADTFSQATVSGIPAGAVTVRAQNPRTGAWVEPTSIVGNSSVVTTGATTAFRFRFPMDCKPVTGAL